MSEFKVPPVLYHGTRVVFDDFEPFSQFASRKTAMCYLERPVHRSSSSMTIEQESITESLSKYVIGAISDTEKDTGNEPKILIPVQLTMRHPFHLKKRHRKEILSLKIL